MKLSGHDEIESPLRKEFHFFSSKESIPSRFLLLFFFFLFAREVVVEISKIQPLFFHLGVKHLFVKFKPGN